HIRKLPLDELRRFRSSPAPGTLAAKARIRQQPKCRAHVTVPAFVFIRSGKGDHCPQARTRYEFNTRRRIALHSARQTVDSPRRADGRPERSWTSGWHQALACPVYRPVVLIQNLSGEQRVHQSQRNVARALPAYSRRRDRRPRNRGPDAARWNDIADIVLKW